MRLRNGLPGVERGMNIFRGLRSYLNDVLGRIPVHFEGGENVEVTEYMPGHWSIDLAENDGGPGSGGGGMKLCALPTDGDVPQYNAKAGCWDPTALALGGGFQYFRRFTSTGTTTWTVPDGVTLIKVEVNGGGGGGGGGYTDYGGGGGGGGAGGYIMALIHVSPGDTFDVVVGASGEGGADGDSGSDGGESSFGPWSYLRAEGGGGGVAGAEFSGGDIGTGGGPVVGSPDAPFTDMGHTLSVFSKIADSGSSGYWNNSSTTPVNGGKGGYSPFGYTPLSTATYSAWGYGGEGGGSKGGDGSDGGKGIVMIWY